MKKAELIKQFLGHRDIAILGASRNFHKFGHKAMQTLLSNSFIVYPVHPDAKEIGGVTCYSSISNLPANVKALYVVTPKRRSNELIDSIIQRGFEVVWLQQASDTPEMINRLAEANIPVVSKECIFMHINPVGVHKFHRAVIKFFKPKAFC